MNTQNPMVIYPAMCKEQQEDVNILLQALDNFGANALALGNNTAHSYSEFIESRSQIKELFENTMKKYRFVKQ